MSSTPYLSRSSFLDPVSSPRDRIRNFRISSRVPFSILQLAMLTQNFPEFAKLPKIKNLARNDAFCHLYVLLQVGPVYFSICNSKPKITSQNFQD